jgi:hypothetical protein
LYLYYDKGNLQIIGKVHKKAQSRYAKQCQWINQIEINKIEQIELTQPTGVETMTYGHKPFEFEFAIVLKKKNNENYLK